LTETKDDLFAQSQFQGNWSHCRLPSFGRLSGDLAKMAVRVGAGGVAALACVALLALLAVGRLPAPTELENGQGRSLGLPAHWHRCTAAPPLCRTGRFAQLCRALPSTGQPPALIILPTPGSIYIALPGTTFLVSPSPAPDLGTLQVGGCLDRPYLLLEQGAGDIAVDSPGVASADGSGLAAR